MWQGMDKKMEKGIGWMDKETIKDKEIKKKRNLLGEKKELPDTKLFTIQDQILTEKRETHFWLKRGNLKLSLPVFLERISE